MNIYIYRNIGLKTPAEFFLVFLFNISKIHIAMSHNIADKTTTIIQIKIEV